MSPAEREAVLKKAILIILLLLILGGAGFFGYQMIKAGEEGKFLDGTVLNGEDISGMTAEEAAETMTEPYAGTRVDIVEHGRTTLSLSLEEAGYRPDLEKTLAQTRALLDSCLKDPAYVARSYASSLAGESEYELPLETIVDQDAFREAVNLDTLDEERHAGADAVMEFDEGAGKMVIHPEVYCTEIDEADLQKAVEEAIGTAIEERALGDVITAQIPEELYGTQPAVHADDPDLVRRCNAYNAYEGTSVTYLFGSEKEVLDLGTIWEWMDVSGNTAVISDEKISEYVAGLAKKYNTRYIARTFKTTSGREVSFPAGKVEYGYTILQDQECAQLKKDLQPGNKVEREPVYYSHNDWGNPMYYGRKGTDDINGTYIEVSLTRQHMWFYIDGELVTESDVVTGDVAKKRETTTGIFPLAYKKHPYTLVGGGPGDEYSVDVEYWMAFFEGQGLHDAPWKSSFGGNIYKTDGSRGCVNLPTDIAKKVYEKSKEGMAIVIYNE